MSYVVIDSVLKTFNHDVVLDHISLTLQKGEFATLLGQSGCGKSTLLRSIAGIIAVDEGSIAINQRDITHLPARKRDVGMVFQSYALFPNMNVFHNIAYGLKIKRHKNIAEKVKKMIEMMDLGGKEEQYPHELSGGQQQRVALARALVLEPSVLLLDEPLSALDAKIRKSLQAELKAIQRELNITTIFVTHDQKEAMMLSDTIHVMNQGKIEQSGTPESIYSKPKNGFVARFIGSYNVLARQELELCVGEQVASSSAELAIRPESITVNPVESDSDHQLGSYVVQGKIISKTLTGNIMSYIVDLQCSTIQVDTLYHTGRSYHEGEPVCLTIPREACIHL